MSQSQTSLLFLSLGIFGSLHCAGMCGPFALGVGLNAGGSTPRSILLSLAYNAGKSLSYAVLGVAAACLTTWVARAGAGLVDGADAHAVVDLARRSLAWIAGLTIMLFAMRTLGWRLWAVDRVRLPLPRWSSDLVGAARSLPGSQASFALGFLNGFLPCGLSWSALALAAGCDAVTAATGMLLFGIATAPVLLGVALCGRLVPVASRTRVAKLAAPALFGFGLLTLARGGLPSAVSAHVDPRPECCRDADAVDGSSDAQRRAQRRAEPETAMRER